MKPETMISRSEFEDLSPYLRGFIVVICGGREDQPNIPLEMNPFRDKAKGKDWEEGAADGYNAIAAKR